MKCFNVKCHGLMICGDCKLSTCDCESMYYSCNKCCHKKCNWCGNSSGILRNSEECEECCEWDYVGDVCESDFCLDYLGGKGNITLDLICNECQSKPAIIRVPLAFPLHLDQIIGEYPNFHLIKDDFLKYYAYSHTTGIWEPYPRSEFRLAQEYFDFDPGVIVLGRSKDDEMKAKNKEALKAEKNLRKLLKKERRLMKIEERTNEKLTKILSL